MANAWLETLIDVIELLPKDIIKREVCNKKNAFIFVDILHYTTLNLTLFEKMFFFSISCHFFAVIKCNQVTFKSQEFNTIVDIRCVQFKSYSYHDVKLENSVRFEEVLYKFK